VSCARQTLAANRITNASVELSDGADAVEVYDLVLSHLPRGRAVVEALIQDAARALKPGGRLYLVAHKRAGVKGAIAYAAEVLGRVGIVRQKGGYHVALATRENAPPAVPQTRHQRFQIKVDGISSILISQPGVFAWDRLDAGTEALIQAMEIGAGETVLDLGCGTGLLALTAVRQGARVTAVDADVRAVESARQTLAANGVTAEFIISDCAQAVMDRRFDIVLCNPPFHQGVGIEYETARQMVRDAATVLRPAGRLYLVSNAFVRYEREMQRGFARVQEIYSNRRYRVLRAIR
jgi:16S rRNA (guanine1207-N2)-methyltransferase